MTFGIKNTIIGLGTGTLLIAYFWLMQLTGLETNFYLRLFNFVIVAAGVYVAIERKMRSSENFTYFEGISSGIRAAIIGVLSFMTFLALYVSYINPAFIEILESAQIWGGTLNLMQAAFAITIEGVASSIVISFIWMQYFKVYTTKQKDLVA